MQVLRKYRPLRCVRTRPRVSLLLGIISLLLLFDWLRHSVSKCSLDEHNVSKRTLEGRPSNNTATKVIKRRLYNTQALIKPSRFVTTGSARLHLIIQFPVLNTSGRVDDDVTKRQMEYIYCLQRNLLSPHLRLSTSVYQIISIPQSSFESVLSRLLNTQKRRLGTNQISSLLFSKTLWKNLELQDFSVTSERAKADCKEIKCIVLNPEELSPGQTIMEKLEVIITVLLLCLVALGVYVATSWTLSRKKKKEDEGDREGVPYKYLDEEAENARKKVATAYAQETMPKITITPVQPRPDFPRSLLSSDELFSDEEEEESQSDDHLDLGRLYFALRYDQHRSMLIVRLIRAEDIPMDREATSTYVDVHLLPLNLQSHTFEPYETTINVSFREVYEFPLSQLDLAQQTLNLHICRYDSYSRRSSIGDVFLALAELSAQGIDFTREVFLCRNIISHQEIYRTLGRRKRLHPVDEEEQEEGEKKPESITKEKKVSRKVSSQRMWDVLRRAAKSGAYKGEYLPSESAMHWESIFSPGASSTEGYRFVSAPTSPVKSPDFAYFSGPGPSGERRDDTSEEEGEEEREESAVDVPTDESEFESSADEQESDRRHVERSQSPPVKTVQLSPAPEEYYRIVPITPFTPYKDKGEVTEPSFSWKLPHTYTSHDRDVVQTLSQAYKEPRVVPFASVSQFEPGAPPAKKVSFNPPSVKSGSDVGEQRSA
ncbi:hypothetical protein ACROYT_G024208 [Oculina patagonica]